ncbi:hypothetical protein FHS76_001939 [Ochrobactrum daejeonense]|uniref:Uncharacterized protein n=1 Tax=Brucella daejeonensis TaxID=659015 RepID=A0A7W9AXI1_9HYPH|nr:hypothetical protein [Brucella daejeonensis]MBB5702064.1 hypothetical protein [Brucella daejeonensis]
MERKSSGQIATAGPLPQRAPRTGQAEAAARAGQDAAGKIMVSST